MTVWTMTKGARTLRCDLEDRPIGDGKELRLYEEEELRRSEVVRNQSEILKRHWEWKQAALATGWQEAS